MKEVVADIWTYTEPNKNIYICIPINCTLKSNGRLVMGAGLAKDALSRYPNLDKTLGDLVCNSTSHIYLVGNLIGFPTKRHWRNPSEIEIIEKSAKELKQISLPNSIVLLPRVGCGLGQLDWKSQVRPLLSSILCEDYFIICSTS